MVDACTQTTCQTSDVGTSTVDTTFVHEEENTDFYDSYLTNATSSDYTDSSESDIDYTDNSENDFDSDGSAEIEDSQHKDFDSDTGFIVYWSSLLFLLQTCIQCGRANVIVKSFLRGSAIVVDLICKEGHKYTWRSQPKCNRYHVGNINLAASILFSSNTVMNIQKYFDCAKIIWISKS